MAAVHLASLRSTQYGPAALEIRPRHRSFLPIPR